MARYFEENALIEFIKLNTPLISGETTLECVERAIRHAPAADAVPAKRGDWLATEEGSDVAFYCSECGAEISTEWEYENDDMWKYCPVCGARMDGR